jgi:hypothetical protein
MLWAFSTITASELKLTTKAVPNDTAGELLSAGGDRLKS